jgi:hypothetical protein
MENKYGPLYLLFICMLLMTFSCESQQQHSASPPGYDLNKPKRYKMPLVLREISGIAFNSGYPDTLYAEQDEEGKVFHFELGDDKMHTTKFGKKGDFEDISICNKYWATEERLVMLLHPVAG